METNVTVNICKASNVSFLVCRLLPQSPPAHIACNLPIAIDGVESLLSQLKTPGFVYASGPRLSGGFVSASGENPPNQRVRLLASLKG